MRINVAHAMVITVRQYADQLANLTAGEKQLYVRAIVKLVKAKG